MINYFPATENDVEAIIKTLGPNKAHGWENISIKMIKICTESLNFNFKNCFQTIY